MIVYLGLGFLLVGLFIFLVSTTSPPALGTFLAFGVIIFSMGLILSLVGLKSGKDEVQAEPLHESDDSTFPLSYLQLELQRSQHHQKADSGNKAFGFVLLSLGIFVLTVSGFFGFYLGSWPLLILGIGLTFSGFVLRLKQNVGYGKVSGITRTDKMLVSALHLKRVLKQRYPNELSHPKMTADPGNRPPEAYAPLQALARNLLVLFIIEAVLGIAAVFLSPITYQNLSVQIQQHLRRMNGSETNSK